MENIEKANKTWSIEISLTEEDFRKVILRAGEVGLTPGEVASAFFNDLVCGASRNGSDEGMYAEQYFDRCFYTGGEYGSFTQFLIARDELEDFGKEFRLRDGDLDEAKEIQTEIALEMDPARRAELEQLHTEILAEADEILKSLRAVFEGFQKRRPSCGQDFETAAMEAVAWWENMERTLANPMPEAKQNGVKA